MFRWLKKKCTRHSLLSFGKRKPVSSKVEERTENDYHIYEEIPEIRVPPQEVAYAIVSLDKTCDDFILEDDNDCPVCKYGCLDTDVPCVCQDNKMRMQDGSNFSTALHSSSVMTIDKNLPRIPSQLPPQISKSRSFSSEDSSSGYDSNSSSSSVIGIDSDFIKRLDDRHVQRKPKNKFESRMNDHISLERKQSIQNRPLPALPALTTPRRPLSFRGVHGQTQGPSVSRRRSSRHVHPCYDV